MNCYSTICCLTWRDHYASYQGWPGSSNNWSWTVTLLSDIWPGETTMHHTGVGQDHPTADHELLLYSLLSDLEIPLCIIPGLARITQQLIMNCYSTLCCLTWRDHSASYRGWPGSRRDQYPRNGRYPGHRKRIEVYNCLLKGAVSRDFLALFYFMNRSHLGPW